MHLQEYPVVAIETLEGLGWKAAGGTAIAHKTYDTAVGPKVALAYLSGPGRDSDYVSLTGDYQSEGHNVLAICTELLPVAAHDDLVRALVTQFSVRADAAVGQSYAAGLLRTA